MMKRTIAKAFALAAAVTAMSTFSAFAAQSPAEGPVPDDAPLTAVPASEVLLSADSYDSMPLTEADGELQLNLSGGTFDADGVCHFETEDGILITYSLSPAGQELAGTDTQVSITPKAQ